MTGSGAKLWIVIARPDRLPAALVAEQALRDQFPGGCHLLRESSVWWDRVRWDVYAKRFASVRDFSRVETCRGIADLPRLNRDIAARVRGMAELPVSRGDCLLCLGGTLSIANAAVSAHRDLFKVFVTARHSYDELTRMIDRKRYRFTTSSWFENRILEPLHGLEHTVNLKPRINRGGDGVRVNRFEKHPIDVFDRVIVMSHSGHELPSDRIERIISSRFPTVAELDDLPATATTAAVPTERRAVFFGSPFLMIRNIEPEIYVEHLNRCLDYIRRYFGDRCRLIYRPHPAETKEASRLNLAGFKTEDDRLAAEVYFLEHFGEIEAVFSVSSTVSRAALANGLNGYCFWRCFPFPPTAAQFFENLMGDVPPEFELRDLDTPPRRSAGAFTAAPDAGSFSQVLSRVFATRSGVP